MTQQDVADALGVSRAAVDSWENDRAYPRSAIGALEQLLNVNLNAPDEPDNGGSRSEIERLADEVRAMRAEIESMAADIRRSRGDDPQAHRRTAAG